MQLYLTPALISALVVLIFLVTLAVVLSIVLGVRTYLRWRKSRSTILPTIYSNLGPAGFLPLQKKEQLDMASMLPTPPALAYIPVAYMRPIIPSCATPPDQDVIVSAVFVTSLRPPPSRKNSFKPYKPFKSSSLRNEVSLEGIPSPSAARVSPIIPSAPRTDGSEPFEILRRVQRDAIRRQLYGEEEDSLSDSSLGLIDELDFPEPPSLKGMGLTMPAIAEEEDEDEYNVDDATTQSWTNIPLSAFDITSLSYDTFLNDISSSSYLADTHFSEISSISYYSFSDFATFSTSHASHSIVPSPSLYTLSICSLSTLPSSSISTLCDPSDSSTSPSPPLSSYSFPISSSIPVRRPLPRQDVPLPTSPPPTPPPSIPLPPTPTPASSFNPPAALRSSTHLPSIKPLNVVKKSAIGRSGKTVTQPQSAISTSPPPSPLGKKLTRMSLTLTNIKTASATSQEKKEDKKGKPSTSHPLPAPPPNLRTVELKGNSKLFPVEGPVKRLQVLPLSRVKLRSDKKLFPVRQPLESLEVGAPRSPTLVPQVYKKPLLKILKPLVSRASADKVKNPPKTKKSGKENTEAAVKKRPFH